MRAHAGPCGTILATVFDSDLRSMDTLRSSRTPSCDFASQSSSRCSSGDLTTLSQVYLALTQPDDFVAGASPLRPKASHYPTATLFAIMYLCLYLGLHPRPPMPKASTKKSKVLWNSCGCFFQRQLSQPFGVRRAPSEPDTVISVVKNPASNSHFINHNKPPHLSNFLLLFSNGDSPPSYLNLSGGISIRNAVVKFSKRK